MKCGTTRCKAAAKLCAYWPGQTTIFCVPCAVRAVRIASAMGFDLTIAPLRLARVAS